MARRTRRPGLTLLEVLLVMAILLTLAAVAYPTLSAMYGDVRVKAAADQVRASWTEARAKAIEDGRAYRFSVEPGTGKFRVAPDGPEFWDDSGGGAGDENAPPPLIAEGKLSDGDPVRDARRTCRRRGPGAPSPCSSRTAAVRTISKSPCRRTTTAHRLWSACGP